MVLHLCYQYAASYCDIWSNLHLFCRLLTLNLSWIQFWWGNNSFFCPILTLSCGQRWILRIKLRPFVQETTIGPQWWRNRTPKPNKLCSAGISYSNMCALSRRTERKLRVLPSFLNERAVSEREQVHFWDEPENASILIQPGAHLKIGCMFAFRSNSLKRGASQLAKRVCRPRFSWLKVWTEVNLAAHTAALASATVPPRVIDQKSSWRGISGTVFTEHLRRASKFIIKAYQSFWGIPLRISQRRGIHCATIAGGGRRVFYGIMSLLLRIFTLMNRPFCHVTQVHIDDVFRKWNFCCRPVWPGGQRVCF